MKPNSLVVAFCAVWLMILVRSSKYSDLSYSALNAAFDSLNGNFASVSTASDLFGIESAKEVSEKVLEYHVHCRNFTYGDHIFCSQGQVSCSPYIVRISDTTSLRHDESRPQVLISGEIHGDERVVSDRKCAYGTVHNPVDIALIQSLLFFRVLA